MSTTRASSKSAAGANQVRSGAPSPRRPAVQQAIAGAPRGGAFGAADALALQAAVGNRAVAGLVQARRGQTHGDEGGTGSGTDAGVHEAARLGTSGAGRALPHLAQIQRSFGRHDVTGVVAHTGAQAQAGAQAMGASAFASGNHVAFAGSADLHTAAHEAAHVVQQRAGVQLSGGVGQVGDRYERHADAVAQAVTSGRSAEPVLDQLAGGRASSAPAVQRELRFEGMKNTPKEKQLEEAFGAVVSEEATWKRLESSKKIAVFVIIDDSSSPNPAEVTNPVHIKDTWGFVLKVRRWMINSYSPGYVIGVLNHEIGVHVLPYLDKLDENIAAESSSKALPHDAAALTARKKGGIDDHERAMAKGNAAFKGYFDLAVGSAEALDKAGKTQAAEDVLFAYLMDLTTMAPDGDKGVIAKNALLPLGKQQQTYAYVRDRYAAYAAELPEGWRERVPKMTTKMVEQTFLDFRSKIPKKKAVGALLGMLILIGLVIWLYKMFA
jgi:Domain of unknown function (DUF4157)